MANQKNIKQLIDQLEKADLSSLAENLKNVASNASNAEKAAAKFLSNLQKGIGEQQALADALKAGYGSLIDSENKAAEAANTRVAALNLVKNSIDQQNASNIQTLANIKQLKEEQTDLLKKTEQTAVSSQKNLDIANDQLKVTKKITPNLKANLDFFDQFSLSVSEGLTSLGKFFGVVTTGAGDIFGAAWDGMPDVVKDAGKLVTAAVATKTALESDVGKKFLTGAVKNFEDLTKLLNKTTTEYAQFTGGVIKGDNAAKNLDGRLMRLQKRSRTLGATVSELAKSMKGLSQSSRTFGILMGTNRKQNTALVDGLTEAAFTFSKVGLNTEKFGKALDVVGKTYKKSNIIKQGKLLGAELVNIGRVTGQSADVIADNFSTAMADLAAYSLPKAREEFKKLSAISAVTGVEMSKVMATAKQFDDIEKTADAVGSLNAMMGGPYLNTLDLVNATEAERIEMLKDMMTQSGESFNTMDRFKQKAIAGAINMDVQDASRLFSGNQKDIDSTTKSIDKQGASYRQLSVGAAKLATSITQQKTAATESGFLMNKTYKATVAAMKDVNHAFFAFGDAARKEIGGVATGVVKKFNSELKGLHGAILQFKATGDLGKVFTPDNMGTLAKWGTFGKEGTALFDATRMMMSADDRVGSEKRVNEGRAILGLPPQATGGGVQATGQAPAAAANQAQVVQAVGNLGTTTATDNAKLLKAMQDNTTAIKDGQDDKKTINVQLSVDGQEMATYVTGFNAQN